MIGSALKKMAKENGMQVAHGVAYGAYRNFALTMNEGAGWKALEFATRIFDPAAEDTLKRKLNEVDLMRTDRVQDLVIGQRSIAIVFHDNPGTMKKIQAFLDWFLHLLEESGATKANICNECGQDTHNNGVGKAAQHIAEDGANRHNTLDTQVQTAGFFNDDLAYSAVQQGDVIDHDRVEERSNNT